MRPIGDNVLLRGLGVLAAVGMIGYAVTYVVALPPVRADGFVATTLEQNDAVPRWFGPVQGCCILLYAFAFLPVVAMVTVRCYGRSPVRLVVCGCLAAVSFVLEIVNNLPAVVAAGYSGTLQQVPDDVALRLHQQEQLDYLSLDVTGFTLIYAAVIGYALVFGRSSPWLARSVVVSVGLFAANVPFLWFSPSAAVLLMAASVAALGYVPFELARLACDRVA